MGHGLQRGGRRVALRAVAAVTRDVLRFGFGQCQRDTPQRAWRGAHVHGVGHPGCGARRGRRCQLGAQRSGRVVAGLGRQSGERPIAGTAVGAERRGPGGQRPVAGRRVAFGGRRRGLRLLDHGGDFIEHCGGGHPAAGTHVPSRQIEGRVASGPRSCVALGNPGQGGRRIVVVVGLVAGPLGFGVEPRAVGLVQRRVG